MAAGKYQQWIEPDGLLKLEAWARDGLNDEQIAKNMGIAVRTLYEYKDKYPQIMHAIKRGKEVIDIEVENSLLKRAMGYEYEETKTVIEQDADGNKKTKVEKVKKQVLPDVTAQIFWLKNRKSSKWRDKPDNWRRKVEAEKLELERRKVELAEKNAGDAGGPAEAPTFVDDLGSDDDGED